MTAASSAAGNAILARPPHLGAIFVAAGPTSRPTVPATDDRSVRTSGPPRLVPRVPPERDRLPPLVIAVSLILHAAVLLPLRGEHAAPPRREISVELVQLPPKREPKPPAPRARAQPPRRPSPRSVAQKPPAPKPTESVADRLKNLLGPMPAFALPATTETGAEPVSYAQLVLSQVAKAKKQGRYRGVPGKAGVAFRLGDKGEIVMVDLVRPSGDPSLDEEAVAMIKRGAPYPPPPPGGQRDYAITLRFSAIP